MDENPRCAVCGTRLKLRRCIVCDAVVCFYHSRILHHSTLVACKGECFEKLSTETRGTLSR